MKEEGGCHVLLTVLLLAVSWKQSWAGCSCMRLAWHHQQSSGHCQLRRESTIFLHPFCWKIPYPLPPFHCLFPHYFGLISFSFPVTTETICPLTHLIPPPILLHVFVFRLLCVLHKSNPLIFFDVCHHARVTNIQANFRVHAHVCVCVCVCVCFHVHACLVHMHVWEAVLCEYRD